MKARFSIAIKFVADMDKAVRFHRDTLGLALKFQSPGWSEFATGEVTLALHPASETHPPGSVELGFNVEDLRAVYAGRARNGIDFNGEPKELHGTLLGSFRDSEGALCGMSGS